MWPIKLDAETLLMLAIIAAVLWAAGMLILPEVTYDISRSLVP